MVNMFWLSGTADRAIAYVRPVESNGKGKYSTEKVDCPDFGTSISLHIKADEAEFLDEHRLRGIISKYSDHMSATIKAE
jgi:molecular chaperone HtpG